MATLRSGEDQRSRTIARETITAMETILAQLDGYTVSRVDTVTERNVRRVSEGYDFLIYGSVENLEGITRIGLTVFSQAAEEVTQTYRRDISSAFELFDAAEEAAVIPVNITIPLLTPMERRILLDTEEQITSLWNDPDATRLVFRLFDRLELLLEDVSYSPDLAEERETYRALRNEYEAVAVTRGTPPPAVVMPRQAAPDWIVGLRVGLGPESINNGPLTEELSYATSLDESGLRLDGQYQRAAFLNTIESGEMTFYLEPRVHAGWGISALLRAGPQVALNRTVRESDTRNFDSGCCEQVRVSDGRRMADVVLWADAE